MSEFDPENIEKSTAQTGNNVPPDADAIKNVLSALTSANSGNAAQNQGGNILSGLLSNPEMLAKLPAMIEAVKPLLGNLSAPQEAETKAEQNANKSDHDKRTALLLALKPYLGKERADAIDYIVKISGITDMLR